LPENAKAAALKGCAARAADCRIIVAAHDICLAVAYERKAGGAYRAATGASKQDAEGKALPVCMAEGPQRCAVLASCSDQPPLLIVSPQPAAETPLHRSRSGVIGSLMSVYDLAQ
jgi:hypothetical protein